MNIENTNVERSKKRKEIDTLVLSGGSFKGVAHIGALKALEDNNILQNIKTIAGSSIGAIIGLLYIIGYSPDELDEFIKMIDLKIFRNIDIENMLDKFGLDDGEKITFVFEKMLQTKNIDTNITFAELYEKTKINFIITGVCVNDKKLYYISHETFPNMKILIGLRITSSVPFYFVPVLYDKKLFIDGGVMNNYPIDIFTSKKNVIGVYLDEVCETNENVDNLETFISGTIDCIFRGVSQSLTKHYEKQTINLILPKFNIFASTVTEEEKKKLYDIGYVETAKYLTNIKQNKIQK